MNKPIMFVKCLLLLFILGATSCNKDLKDDVNDLKNRVTTIEESVTLLQQAIERGKLITDVTPIAATSTTPAGWEIKFSGMNPISIYNGKDGNAGSSVQTPYVWINSNGNWASKHGEKPADSDNAIYEIKVGGNSVKAYGTSVRTSNINGFICFEEYDAISGDVKNTVTTTIPYDHKNYMTSIIETNESVTMTINNEDYVLAKAAVYPMSITVIRDKDYVSIGGTVTFNIAVNPSTSKVYAKDDFELDYEKDYVVTRGINPDFITIKDVQPATIKGQYVVTLEWAESNTQFAKNAAIFIILNFKDVEGNLAKIVSATPVIMNEKYISITDANVLSVNDIYMFTDETFTDSVRLSNYHSGYVNSVDFTIDAPLLAVNPFTRYTSVGNKYKFTVVPIPGTNTAIWPTEVYSRIVDAKASVLDYGRAATPAIEEDINTGQPAIPGGKKIAPITITKNFKVHVYKVPENGVIYQHRFQDYWIPNKTVDYRHTVALGAQFAKNGYVLNGWDFAIKSQTLKKDGAVVGMANNITADDSKFDMANNFTTSYKLLPTIYNGVYTVEFVVTATPKTPRPNGLSQQSREFKILMNFKVVAPTFTIEIKDGHNVIGVDSDTYYTNKLADVNVADLLDVRSTKNISKNTDVSPDQSALSYEFDQTAPAHAQGVRFNPYPVVTAPMITEWGAEFLVKRPITVFVKLDTGQEIPVNIICTTDATQHARHIIYVQYDRLNLDHVDAQTDRFNGNYSTMAATGIDVAANNNFSPKSITNKLLDPTMITSIVFTEIGTVQAQGGDTEIPNGLENKKILQIDQATGVVKSIDGTTWNNPNVVLFQSFRITYTDIWGNHASKEFNVYIKSNSVPTM